jgi:integrase
VDGPTTALKGLPGSAYKARFSETLAIYLGHSNPGFTLRVYTHLMPASEERTRRAIDSLLGSEDDQ